MSEFLKNNNIVWSLIALGTAGLLNVVNATGPQIEEIDIFTKVCGVLLVGSVAIRLIGEVALAYLKKHESPNPMDDDGELILGEVEAEDELD